MLEIISTIALLCQINPGATWAEKAQLSCQKYYVRCVRDGKNGTTLDRRLEKCVLDRKLRK
jgi:hypothetical protein